MSQGQIKNDILGDDLAYTALVQDLSLVLHDIIFEKKGDELIQYKKFFSPGVFDGLVNVLS